MGAEVETRRLLNLTMAAKARGVSRRTLYNWVYQGKLELVQTKYGPRVYEDQLQLAISGRRDREGEV